MNDRERKTFWLLNEHREPEPYTGTFVRKLDEFIHGYFPGELTLLGGVPQAGKTTFAIWTASRMLLNDIPIVYFAAVEKREFVFRRLVNSFSHIEKPEVSIFPDIVSNERNLENIANILRQRIDALEKKPVVFIDYLQALKIPVKQADYPYFSDTERINQLILRVKDISCQMNVPIILLAQVDIPLRPDKRPRLEDFPVPLQTVPDNVIFIYRHGIYDLEYNKQSTQTIEMLLAKSRNWHWKPELVRMEMNLASSVVYENKEGKGK